MCAVDKNRIFQSALYLVMIFGREKPCPSANKLGPSRSPPPLGEDILLLHSMRGREQLSTLFERVGRRLG